MANISYWEKADRITFKSNEGIDFVSPATQDAWNNWSTGSWRPTFASRNTVNPMWERPDVFRTIRYTDTRKLRFEFPRSYVPASQVLPSGMLSFQTMRRSSPLIYPDYEKYHYNVQRVFIIMVQFDVLLEDQIAAFAGLERQEVSRIMEILWGLHIVDKPDWEWVHQNRFGPVWRLIRYSPQTKAYVSGMDPYLKVCAFGNDDLSIYPPGSAARGTIKHNLFCAETVLRVLESADNVVGAWGDHFGSERLFHVQNPNAERRNSHADAILVTNNGSVVILEYVSSVKRTMGSMYKVAMKTASWVGVIANSHLDISVVFVAPNFGTDAKYLMNAVDIGLKKESPRFAPDKFLRERALGKVGIVAGGLWFPESGTISEAGTRLMGFSVWDKKYKCFDEPDPRFSDSQTRKDVIINTVMAPHNPPWMVNGVTERVF